MDDRELLELAAKAAGIPRSRWDYDELRRLGHMVTRSMMWNPLANDGDALRLAGELRLRISISNEHEYTEVVFFHEFGQRRSHGGVVEQWATDRDAATRRAIVRAAAAIEKEAPRL